MHFLQPVGLETAASHTVRPAGGRGAAPASGGQSPFAKASTCLLLSVLALALRQSFLPLSTG